MCFGSRDKDEETVPAPRPAPVCSSIDKSSKDTKKQQKQQPYYDASASPGPSQQALAPPPSQPPYAPPASAPPEKYAPPSGPPPPMPPAYAAPPPSYDNHDWQAAVPDTALFPPPPAIFSGFDQSPTSNATEEEAIAGEEWCEQYPFTRPMTLDDETKGALHFHNIRLMEPMGFNGKLTWLGQGHWSVSTQKTSPDRCLISYPPLYSVNEHSAQPRTIYYEVRVLSNSPTVYIGMGFTALPYPSFRMPGWHRGSLAVHGDDGHKYINDRWGGKEFTRSFQRGETYGIGVTVKPTEGGERMVDIFFTRNGVLAGGWNIHEETDAEQDLPVTGLEGRHDLCAAVGVYDGVEAEVVFEPEMWLYEDLRTIH